MGVLSGCSVLDLTDEKGTFCVKLLAGMGAGVIRLSPITQVAQLRETVKTSEILVESFPPGYLETLSLGYKDLKKINPGIIVVSITPFGQSGPYRDFNAYDLTLQAMGGWLSVTGGPLAPLKLYGSQAFHTAALFAVNGILLALRQKHETGQGQFIDISIMECVAAMFDHVLVRYFYEDVVSGRQGSRRWDNAFEILRCKDGYILISLHQQWETLVEWLMSEGMAEDLTEERWHDRAERNRGIEHVIEVLERWTLTHKVEELVEKGQLMHFPWAEIALIQNEQKR